MLTVVTTFHAEGALAHLTLRSLRRSAAFARESGLNCRFNLVMDRPDEDTVSAVTRFDFGDTASRIIECDFGDPSSARNAGLAKADSEYAMVTDGDDYYSKNWLTGAVDTIRLHGASTIAHPDYSVSFGEVWCVARTPDQVEDRLRRGTLLMANFSGPWVAARREVFERVPYEPIDIPGGFGHEDWHWNCESIAAGYVHRRAEETCVFYRRRPQGQLTRSNGQNVVIRPTALFATGGSA